MSRLIPINLLPVRCSLGSSCWPCDNSALLSVTKSCRPQTNCAPDKQLPGRDNVVLMFNELMRSSTRLSFHLCFHYIYYIYITYIDMPSYVARSNKCFACRIREVTTNSSDMRSYKFCWNLVCCRSNIRIHYRFTSLRTRLGPRQNRNMDAATGTTETNI